MATINERIRKLVNFYFSDYNLPYDRFLYGLHSRTEEHWIPLETITKFKKMQWITTDFQAVVDALKEEESDIYELNEDSTQIRRKGAFKEREHFFCSIHVKGLPVETIKDSSDEFALHDKVEALFNAYAPVVNLRFKKTDERPFKLKGSAYIEFASSEEAKKVAALKTVDMDGAALELLYKPDYIEQKKASGTEPNRKRNVFNIFKANKGGKAFNHNKRKRDDNRPKKQDKRAKTATATEDTAVPEVADVASKATETEVTQSNKEVNKESGEVQAEKTAVQVE